MMSFLGIVLTLVISILSSIFSYTMVMTGPSSEPVEEVVTEVSAPASPVTPTATAEVPEGAYGIGDIWTVDGQWSLVVTSVDETDERNEYSDTDPEAVYIVSYSYKNIGYESDYSDGLYLSIDDGIVDSASQMGYSYPGDITFFPSDVPVGAVCDAQVCIGVDNAGSFLMNFSTYDGNDEEQDATFFIDLSAEPADGSILIDGTEGTAAGIPMGETWTVDGQWEVTINSVAETDERNEFADTDPAAVYIVDYTYTNIGYEDDIWDGLYLSLDQLVIDNGHKVTYSYPLSVTRYPEETPVGATCNAQICVGVETPGDFQLIVSNYDGNDERQSATFDVTVN